MAKEKENTILKKGSSQFQLIGEAKINDYTFKIDEESNSGWIYNNMNLGVDCGNGNTVYCDMMGGYSSVNDSVIYVHGKKDDNGKEVDDYENRFTIDWDDRFDEDIINQVGKQCFITVGLEKDAKDKTFIKKFLSSYDAIAYIQEHLEKDTVINVKGNLKYSEYQGNTQLKKEVNSVFLSKADNVSKYSATFQQTILVDKDSIGKYDKEIGAFPITAYTVDYVGKYGASKQEIKQNVVFTKIFQFEVAETEIEKGTKLLNKLFKAKKDNINEIMVEGNIVEGQAKINITLDDVPEDIRELIELGAYTEEEALAKCAVGNTREKKMVIKKPVIRIVGEGDEKTPVIMRTDDKYKFDDLVFLSQLIKNDDEDEEDDDKNSKKSNDKTSSKSDDETKEYSLDDLDALLDEIPF
ncbi:MAG: hypothetical protein PHF88_01525 [Candidatus Pacebacteria bacterium]|nr:hypothetical protein [Candidatus Paceibacterota bacterium]